MMHAIAMEMDEIESHVFSEDELPSMKIYASMHACHKVIKHRAHGQRSLMY